MTGVAGLFLTLTAPGAVAHLRQDGTVCPCTPVEGTDLGRWNSGCGPACEDDHEHTRSASYRWNRFMLDLSRLLGADVVWYGEDGKRHRKMGLSYFKAAEVQRRGALHFHALVRRKDGRPVRASRRDVRRLAIRWGFGHAVDVQRLEPGHATYVAKYVAKSADERRDAPWDARVYVKPAGMRLWQGWLVDEHGEIRGRPLRTRQTTPTFRTWSASRDWGDSMADVRQAQQHYVMVLDALPAWSDRATSPGWSRLDVPARPAGSRIAEQVPT